ncbi:MAG: 1-acyl-sn-glycerol-3-phosphate acyltransferase [Elusimicrobia bacterium]|nr:1-acyl-sn-glycerol-3-phosphate acyltransferase [Elusimicrobiota bacterium]
MGKEELFRIPVFGWILRQVNAFPIRRKEGDIAAIKAAERILNAGGALIVFPEGRRQRTGQLAPPKRGVGLLAVRTGVPVLPVYVHNAHRILRLARITLVFGRPISPDVGETAEVFSQRVMDAIRQLKETHFGTPS